MSDPSESEFIKLPSFPHRQVTADFRKMQAVIEDAIASVDYAPDRGWLAGELAKVIGQEVGRPQKAIRASIDDLYDSYPPSQATVRRVAYRLAANKKRLMQGFASLGKTNYVAPHWARAKICGVEFIPKPYRQQTYLYVAWRVLSGRLAGEQIIERVSIKSAWAVLRMAVGWRNRIPRVTPKQLMYLEAALVIDTNDDGSIRIEKRGITQAMRSSNVKLTKQRSRNHNPCPYGRRADCWQCPVGINECDRSVVPLPTNRLKK